MFELKDAIKKSVAVVAPNVFLVNEVLAMWNLSAKDQKALTAVIKYAKDEVDVPDATDATPKKKDKSGYQGSGAKGGAKGRQSGYQGSGNYGKNNQSFGNSYSSKQGQRQNNGNNSLTTAGNGNLLALSMTSLEPTPTRQLLLLK